MTSPADTGTQRWKMAGAAPMPVRDWDGEFAVFNPCSGHTHILDFTAGTLLQLLADGPRDEAELAQAIAARLELPADSSLQEPLRRLLAQLDEQGLITAVPPC